MSAAILTIETASLGNHGYLAHDGHVGIVIDPPRDVDRILALARRVGVRITHVFETHIHNDYVSGGLELARSTRAKYFLPAGEHAAFHHEAIGDDETLQTGSLTIRALHTPGHTFHHMAYVVMTGGRVVGVCSGGSLLHGSTGRPDLFGPDATPELARAQHQSARRLLIELPLHTGLHPTHGFGSFCSASSSRSPSGTLAEELSVNPALTRDESDFVRDTLAALTAYPTYFGHVAVINRAGPPPADLSLPPHIGATGLRDRLQAGEWVIDLRSGAAFARQHVPGTLSFGMATPMSTYLGWLLPWGTPVTLLGSNTRQISEGQRQLVRIGIDRPSAMAVGDPRSWRNGQPLRSFRVADFAGLASARARRDITVLDVRRNEEWQTSHLVDALHVPLHELPQRREEIPPPPTEVWVHCQSGYRAAIAASLLENDHTVVLVDDDYGRIKRTGLVTC